jgi:hypothetical protein
MDQELIDAFSRSLIESNWLQNTTDKFHYIEICLAIVCLCSFVFIFYSIIQNLRGKMFNRVLNRNFIYGFIPVVNLIFFTISFYFACFFSILFTIIILLTFDKEFKKIEKMENDGIKMGLRFHDDAEIKSFQNKSYVEKLAYFEELKEVRKIKIKKSTTIFLVWGVPIFFILLMSVLFMPYQIPSCTQFKDLVTQNQLKDSVVMYNDNEYKHDQYSGWEPISTVEQTNYNAKNSLIYDHSTETSDIQISTYKNDTKNDYIVIHAPNADITYRKMSDVYPSYMKNPEEVSKIIVIDEQDHKKGIAFEGEKLSELLMFIRNGVDNKISTSVESQNDSTKYANVILRCKDYPAQEYIGFVEYSTDNKLALTPCDTTLDDNNKCIILPESLADDLKDIFN